MPGRLEDDEKKRRAAMAAGEGTHFRGEVAREAGSATATSGRHTDTYHHSGKSLRLSPRTPRSGLAMKLAMPIIAAMLVCYLAAMFLLQQRLSNLQLDDLRADAANAAYLVGVLGRFIIVHREKFLYDFPSYLRRAEWRTGDHWLVASGFVGEEEWERATGFGMSEFAPIQALDRAAEKTILSGLDEWVNASGNHTEIVAAFLLNADGTAMATSIDNSFPIGPLALKSIPAPAEYKETGGYRVGIDYVPGLEPGPVMRGTVGIMSLREPGAMMGSAVVALRTTRHDAGRQAFLFMAGAVLLALVAVMSLACWYAANRVTAPMRRLAADMQAMAEGDYARRSGLAESSEIGLVAQAFNSMAERLRVARANEQETSRLESDLATARSIQNSLLPPQTPHAKGLDIHTVYRPAREIGGDYFDFLPVDSEHMGIVIADASGKSIPAALVMSTTRAILRFVAPGSASAAETLTRVNAILSVDIPSGMFVTAYYLILDPLSDAMLCASAGHTPLLIARADNSVEQVNPGGIALGFDSGPVFQRSIREQRVRLAKGDRVLLYTDGVVECVNTENEEYSDRRLREFLRRNRELSSHDFVGALLADLDRHRGAAEIRDDTTIVTFKVV